jgi:hypothetical protein
MRLIFGDLLIRWHLSASAMKYPPANDTSSPKAPALPK